MPASIVMHHYATTGKKDEYLSSLLNDGIRIPGGYVEVSNQRNGFYVTSNKHSARTQSITQHQHHERPGKPLLVSVECDFGPHFDLDYELSLTLAKEIFLHFRKILIATPPSTLKLREGYSIHSITEISDEFGGGLEIALMPKTRATPPLFMPWKEYMQVDNVAEAGLLQTFRDHLVTTAGERYLRHEANVIKKTILRHEKEKHPYGISMKYHGRTPPGIVRLEIFDGRYWKKIAKP